MDKITARILFEEPFWIGIFERTEGTRLSVSKVTFGAEPKGYELYDYIQKLYYNLRFTQAIELMQETKKRINPKRRDREARKSMLDTTIATKSQQALKREQEKGKQERKIQRKEKEEQVRQYKFEQKQQKRKEKHKGH